MAANIPSANSVGTSARGGSIWKSALHEAFLWAPIVYVLGPNRLPQAEAIEEQLSEGNGAHQVHRHVLIHSASWWSKRRDVCLMATEEESRSLHSNSATLAHRALQHFAVPVHPTISTHSPTRSLKTKPSWTEATPQYILAILYVNGDITCDQQSSFSVGWTEMRHWRKTCEELQERWVRLLEDVSFCQEVCRDAQNEVSPYFRPAPTADQHMEPLPDYSAYLREEGGETWEQYILDGFGGTST